MADVDSVLKGPFEAVLHIGHRQSPPYTQVIGCQCSAKSVIEKGLQSLPPRGLEPLSPG